MARVQQSSFSILLALGTGVFVSVLRILNTIDSARFMFACGFTFCPFLLLSASAWRKPAPEESSRCLTIAPTGYHSSLRLYFSVSSPSSRRSQISHQPLLFMADFCKITSRCRLHLYAGALANHHKRKPIHALYGLSTDDYSTTKGTAMAVDDICYIGNDVVMIV